MIRANICARGHPVDLCPESCGASDHRTGYAPEALADYAAELRWRKRLKQENDNRIAELEAILR